MKNKAFSTLALVFFIISIILIYLSYENFKNTESSSFKISNENNRLKEEKNQILLKINADREALKDKQMRLNSLKEEVDKFESLEQKEELDKLFALLKNYEMELVPGTLDYFYIDNLQERSSFERPLDGLFFESDLNYEDVWDNLNLLSLYINNYVYLHINSLIAKNNSEILETIGIMDYLEKGDNYLVKSQILENTSEIENIKMNYFNGLSLLERNLDYWENILFTSPQKNFSKYHEDIARMKGEHSDFQSFQLKKSQLKDLNLMEAFTIELLNSSTPYLLNLRIEEVDQTKYLRKENNQDLMIEDQSQQ
ncbi:MAG: hypothetical protein Q4P25_04815, partial [Tissierellia bacterium]|nr:hypothetical protein [Tissierellia bacterium]